MAGALEQWRQRGLHEITLPTLTRIKMRIPAPEALLAEGNMPDDLRLIVLRWTVTTVSLGRETDAETLDGMLRMTQRLVAAAVQQVWNDETKEWEDYNLTLEDVAAGAFPAEDLTMIESVALRRFTPAQATEISLKQAGQPVPPEVAKAKKEEAGSSMAAFATFRGEQGRADSGADSGAVRAKSGTRLPRNQRPDVGAVSR